MRKPSKSMAMRQFDQAWERFCSQLPAAPAPITARLRAGALMQATGTTAAGLDMDDEQAAAAVQVLDRLCCQIADYHRARHELLDAFVLSVSRGSTVCSISREISGLRISEPVVTNWRKSSALVIRLLEEA